MAGGSANQDLPLIEIAPAELYSQDSTTVQNIVGDQGPPLVDSPSPRDRLELLKQFIESERPRLNLAIPPDSPHSYELEEGEGTQYYYSDVE
jgi:hypothetical protein